MSSKPRTKAQKAARRERDRKRREEQKKALAKSAKKNGAVKKSAPKKCVKSAPNKPQTKNINAKPNKSHCSCKVKPGVFLIFCDCTERVAYKLDVTEIRKF